jgi:hypothetical protein
MLQETALGEASSALWVDGRHSENGPRLLQWQARQGCLAILPVDRLSGPAVAPNPVRAEARTQSRSFAPRKTRFVTKTPIKGFAILTIAVIPDLYTPELYTTNKLPGYLDVQFFLILTVVIAAGRVYT